MTTDILFRDCPEPDMLREVAASAFEVPVDRVSVIESVGPEPIPDDALVVFMHQPDAMPGDFPAWYGLNVAPDLLQNVDAAVDAMARELSTVALTDAPNDNVTIHLPDGSGRVVDLVQDEDDAFLITPEIQAIIDEAFAGPRPAQSTGDGPVPVGLGGGRDSRVRRAS